MADTPAGPEGRLDSWKAIAEYLGRDVATVRRWEKSLGLPVRRFPGGRGRSVFAFRNEIDEWLKSQGTDTPAEPWIPAGEAAGAAAPPAARRLWPLALAAAVVLGLVSVLWRTPIRGAADSLRIVATTNAIVAETPDQKVGWRYDFPDGQRIDANLGRVDGPATRLPGDRGFIVGVVGTQHVSNDAYGPGELLWLADDGRLRKRTTFDERLNFGARTFDGPWMLADYRMGDDLDPRRIAVAIRHVQWWPSVVSVLDADWKPTQRFVNAGWVEHLAWLGDDRLLISGYYNPLESGMVALLDTRSMHGQSPPSESVEFTCTSCGAAAPLRYVLLPASEVHRVVGAPFNRASLHPARDRIIVRTIEEPNEAGYAAEALYEFSPSLDLVAANYGDRYWDRHRALEAAGKIHHARERCPERRGPPYVMVWERATGWKKVRPPAGG